MINFNDACQIAVQYFVENTLKTGICKALDTDGIWIFFGGKLNEVEFGGYGVSVNKATGNVEDFILPSDKNFALLDKAIVVEIPAEFISK